MEIIPMAFKLGTLKHAKGYIINKLFEDHRIGGKHLPVEILSHGYPLEHRPLIREAYELLKTENPSPLHIEDKRTGRGTSAHVSLVPSMIPRVRGLMNGYRKSVGLQAYGEDLKTLLPLRRHSRTSKKTGKGK
jgi:hypothetical protein